VLKSSRFCALAATVFTPSCTSTNLPAASQRSNDPREFANLHRNFKSSILFLLRNSLLRHLRPAWTSLESIPTMRQRNYSSWALPIPTLSEVFALTDFTRLRQLSKVLKSSQIRCTHSHCNHDLSLLRLATETSIRPALYLRGLNNPTQPWSMRIRASLLNPLDALYAEEFDCTLCRNLLVRKVKHLKLILSFLPDS
jgi:hypothetical protein